MKAFFGEPALKEAIRQRVAEHHRLDQIMQRRYWTEGRGCFLGCSLHEAARIPARRYKAFEELLGLPSRFAALCEWVFESLPSRLAPDFVLRMYDAIPVGAELPPADDFVAGLDEEIRNLWNPRVTSVYYSVSFLRMAAISPMRMHRFVDVADRLIEWVAACAPEEEPVAELPTDPAFKSYYEEVKQGAA